MANSPLTAFERAAVERLVSQATGTPAKVVHEDVIWERAHAVRARLADDREVVIKRPRRDRRGDTPPSFVDAWRREWWGLAALAGIDPPIAPRFHGASAAARVVVMEALPPGRSVAAALLDDDPARATAGLVALATSLGRIHAETAGDSRVLELAAETGVTHPGVRIERALRDGLAALRAEASDLGVDVPATCETELLDVATALAGYGPGSAWRTFVHRDPCPDNTRLAADGHCRVFDFERGAIGSAALDAAHLVAPMPTCWCFGKIPEATTQAALAAYEDAVRDVFPVSDLLRQVAYAISGSVIAKMVGLRDVLAAEQHWGTTGVRPRTLRWLDTTVVLTETVDELPALRRACGAIAAALRHRWPEALEGWYPAFAPLAGAATVEVPTWWDPSL